MNLLLISIASIIAYLGLGVGYYFLAIKMESINWSHGFMKLLSNSGLPDENGRPFGFFMVTGIMVSGRNDPNRIINVLPWFLFCWGGWLIYDLLVIVGWAITMLVVLMVFMYYKITKC